MLNFRNTNIFFLILLTGLAVYNGFYPVPFYFYLIIIFIYTLVLFYGSYFISAGFYLSIPCSGPTTEKKIAISFDDGPAASYTEQILQVLKKHDIKAAFFCIGKRIEGNELLLKQVHSEGHLIGNHSFSHHFWFDLFSSPKMLKDIQSMDEKVAALTGMTPKLFRPPYGVTNPNLKRAIIRGGYTPIGWSVRSMDTVIKDENKLLAKINKAIGPGAVFLFHDTSKTTLQVLPAFISEVKSRGYSIERLDKLLNVNAYA